MQVDAQQEQRPEQDREHGRDDALHRVEVLEVVLRLGDEDPDGDVDQAQELAREQHGRNLPGPSAFNRLPVGGSARASSTGSSAPQDLEIARVTNAESQFESDPGSWMK